MFKKYFVSTLLLILSTAAYAEDGRETILEASGPGATIAITRTTTAPRMVSVMFRQDRPRGDNAYYHLSYQAERYLGGPLGDTVEFVFPEESCNFAALPFLRCRQEKSSDDPEMRDRVRFSESGRVYLAVRSPKELWVERLTRTSPEGQDRVQYLFTAKIRVCNNSAECAWITSSKVDMTIKPAVVSKPNTNLSASPFRITGPNALTPRNGLPDVMTWTTTDAAVKGYYLALGRDRDCKVTYWDAVSETTNIEIPPINVQGSVFLCATALGQSASQDVKAINSGMAIPVL